MGTRIFISEARADNDQQAAAASDAVAKATGWKVGSQIRRFREINNPVALAVSIAKELPAVPADIATTSTRFTTLVGEQLSEQKRSDIEGAPDDIPLLYMVYFRIPESRQQEMADWYEQEHMPLLQKCEYWKMTRRVRLKDTGGPTNLALHYLSDIRALRSPERTAARNTAWRDRLSQESWFKATYKGCLQETPGV